MILVTQSINIGIFLILPAVHLRVFWSVVVVVVVVVSGCMVCMCGHMYHSACVVASIWSHFFLSSLVWMPLGFNSGHQACVASTLFTH